MIRFLIKLTVLLFLIAPLVSSAQTLFPRNLFLGSKGEDVRQLQQLLNTNPATQLASSGAGSPGLETDYFGPLTQAATTRFQELYAAAVLTPLGLSGGTGFFGPSTRSALNSLPSPGAGVSAEAAESFGNIAQQEEDFDDNDAPGSPFLSLIGLNSGDSNTGGTSNTTGDDCSSFPDGLSCAAADGCLWTGDPQNQCVDADPLGLNEAATSSRIGSAYENPPEDDEWYGAIAGLALQPFGGRIVYIEYNCLCSLSVLIEVANTTGRSQPVQYMFYYGFQLLELLGIDIASDLLMQIGLPPPRLYEYYALYEGPQVLGNYLPGEYQCWAFVGPPSWCQVTNEAQGAIIQMGTSLY